VHWPEGLKGLENTINHATGHVMDILPTCMELAGANYPLTINGLQTSPPEGKSLMSLLTGKLENRHDTLFWEHEGGKAARIGDWKISALKNKPWELYNMAEDRTETNNLAINYPEKVKQMSVLWDDWYDRVNN
jgi:arylsulfatase